ncbi:uncharacterized protein LOC143253111 [Tachypleus tridentatus]|uniref:uncharacterized protein LOC143253111 n=1 Tax=Tachypleus tridentatus TaxID=6853 RepID=UPI003FD334B2
MIPTIKLLTGSVLQNNQLHSSIMGIPLLITVTLASFFQGARLYQLYAPDSYIVLSGDIDVVYKFSKDSRLMVELVELNEEKHEVIFKKDIPKNLTYGKLSFPCGLVDHAGFFFFRMFRTNGENDLARSNVINVSWPHIKIHVPLLVETYTSEVIVHLDGLASKCSPHRINTYPVTVNLLYFGPSMPLWPEMPVWQYSDIVFTKELPEWLFHNFEDITLECNIFDRAGFYQIQIIQTSYYNPLSVESEWIQAIWSTHYSLKVPNISFTLCPDRGVAVQYHYPRCVLGRDLIRVFGSSKKLGVITRTDYIFESKIKVGSYTSLFPCHLFLSGYEIYCFTYVSMGRNGAVFDLKTVCVPHDVDTVRKQYVWTSWSSWTGCSAVCGEGVRSRYRLCAKAFHCGGSSIETKSCQVTDCPETTTFLSDSLYQVTCNCSCTVNVTGKGMLQAYASLKFCRQNPVWLLKAMPVGTISVQFQEINFNTKNVWLVTRDGNSKVGIMLNVIKNVSSEKVFSQSSILQIELQTAYYSDDEIVEFKAEFSRIGKKDIVPLNGVSSQSSKELSAVHLVIIIFVSVLFGVILFLLLLQQLHFSYHQKTASFRCSSTCSSLKIITKSCSNVNAPDIATSLSELSCSSTVSWQDKERTSGRSSPEDFLQDTFLFRSTSSVYTIKPQQNPCTKVVKANNSSFAQSTVQNSSETKTPHPSVKPKKSILKKSKHITSHMEKKNKKSPYSPSIAKVIRNNCATVKNALSETSVALSEDGFEYDYYDYTCHDIPGSFFCSNPAYMDWPPFVPIPPNLVLPDVLLQQSSPTHSSNLNNIESSL